MDTQDQVLVCTDVPHFMPRMLQLPKASREPCCEWTTTPRAVWPPVQVHHDRLGRKVRALHLQGGRGKLPTRDRNVSAPSGCLHAYHSVVPHISP